MTSYVIRRTASALLVLTVVVAVLSGVAVRLQDADAGQMYYCQLRMAAAEPCSAFPPPPRPGLPGPP